MYKLFVYGTLKLESVQKKLLGHTLESYDAKNIIMLFLMRKDALQVRYYL